MTFSSFKFRIITFRQYTDRTIELVTWKCLFENCIKEKDFVICYHKWICVALEIRSNFYLNISTDWYYEQKTDSFFWCMSYLRSWTDLSCYHWKWIHIDKNLSQMKYF
jgi:hypothetical protein